MALAYGRSASIRCTARRSRAAATIAMARVIFSMFVTDRDAVTDVTLGLCHGGRGGVHYGTNAASSPSPFPAGRQRHPAGGAGLLDTAGADGPLRRGRTRSPRRTARRTAATRAWVSLTPVPGRRSAPAGRASVARDPLDQLEQEPLDLVDRDPVEESVGRGVDLHDLLLDRHRVALGLVQRLHQPLATSQRPLGVGVELGAELGERLELAVLGELELQAAGDLRIGVRLGVATDSGDRDTDVDGRAHAGVEEMRLEVDLPVGDGDHVGRDVGRHVTGLRLDDRQRGERPATGELLPGRRIGDARRPA